MNSFIGILATILVLAAANGHPTESLDDWSEVIPENRVVEIVNPLPKNKVKGRIYKGKDVTQADQSTYKHQVKLVTVKAAGSFGCGGSIISPRVVLTAAHCVENGIKTTVYFGVLDQQKRNDAQQQTVDASGWIIHEGYDTNTIQNDIAVILLPKPIQFSSTVGPVALPPKNACPSFANIPITISGWGVLNDAYNAPKILQSSNIKTAQPEQCSKLYGIFDKNSMICADATNSGTCQGDSGGPMIWNNNGVPTVIGATSFGAEGCANNSHRVFTCVAAFLDWIQKNAGGLLKKKIFT